MGPANNGSTITRYEYRLWRPRLGHCHAFDGLASTASTSTTATVTGLTNGTPTTSKSEPVNAIGDSRLVERRITETGQAPHPQHRINLDRTKFGETEVPPSRLRRSCPNDNGSAITRYEYRLDDGNGFGTAISAGTSTTATVTGLTNGTAYDFQIRAVNAIGHSWAWSTSLHPTTSTQSPLPLQPVPVQSSWTGVRPNSISVGVDRTRQTTGKFTDGYAVRQPFDIESAHWPPELGHCHRLRRSNDPITGLMQALRTS